MMKLRLEKRSYGQSFILGKLFSNFIKILKIQKNYLVYVSEHSEEKSLNPIELLLNSKESDKNAYVSEYSTYFEKNKYGSLEGACRSQVGKTQSKINTIKCNKCIPNFVKICLCYNRTFRLVVKLV